eukprot:scaffold18198_cov43-Prasinocladus_malaysianus.AAC.4
MDPLQLPAYTRMTISLTSKTQADLYRRNAVVPRRAVAIYVAPSYQDGRYHPLLPDRQIQQIEGERQDILTWVTKEAWYAMDGQSK